jgi:hypothetical protein
MNRMITRIHLRGEKIIGFSGPHGLIPLRGVTMLIHFGSRGRRRGLRRSGRRVNTVELKTLSVTGSNLPTLSETARLPRAQSKVRPTQGVARRRARPGLRGLRAGRPLAAVGLKRKSPVLRLEASVHESPA